MIPLDSTMYFSDPGLVRFVDNAQAGNAAFVRSELRAGRDPNASGAGGIRPLHFALAAATPEVAEVLLAAGADPNAAAPSGDRPLHYAVQLRKPGFTEALLRHGADPRQPGEGGKPVTYPALSSPSTEVILPLLVTAGADVNLRWGVYPPLQAAVVQQNWSLALLLLRLGADPAQRTTLGSTAAETFCKFLQRARPRNGPNPQVVALGERLRAHGMSPECQNWLESYRLNTTR
jgi:ankyrin repeat protein